MISNPCSLLCKVFNMKDNNGNIANGFHKNIIYLLNNLGISFMHSKSLVTKADKEMISRKIKDTFIQNWFTDIENSSKLHCYRSFKTCFEYENYLNCVINDKQRIELTRLRCSSHHLLIEEGRFSSIPRENKICKLCNLNKKEDEFHFVLICPHYHQIRSQFIPNFYYTQPSSYKFILLMKNYSKKTANDLSKYLCMVNDKRQSIK